MDNIACIILNYRALESTLRLIQSVRANTWSNVSIFVVDNDPQPENLAVLKKEIGEANVIASPANLGYAGGLNLGIRAALKTEAKFFWILTQDLTVEPNCLEILHDLWGRLEKPGFLGSLTDLNGTEQVYFFRAQIDKRGATKHGNKGRSIAEIPELREKWGKTDYVNGACVFTSREVLHYVGLIPEDYFMYFEDCEWSLRASRQGYKNYVSYRSRIHHHREVGGFNANAEYYCRRNSFLFKKRNGFTRPWTKSVELLKLRIRTGKTWWRGNHKLLEVLKVVARDLQAEKMGRGPWPRG
jgi:GT2 family glycosyltransferase